MGLLSCCGLVPAYDDNKLLLLLKERGILRTLDVIQFILV